MNTEFTLTQKRALAVITIISLLFAGYFLRNYFVLIVVAAVGAYLFRPLFNWFNRRLSSGLAATCTLLSALAVVIVPVGLLVVLMIVIVITIDVYLAVYKGVELEEPVNKDPKPGWLTRWKAHQSAKPAAP